MPKRKRDGREIAASERHTRNVQESILHGTKTLHRALKVAKGFERQKLGRRHKAAEQKHDEGEIGRIDAEIDALKTLDLHVASESYLYKTMLKEKSIASSTLLPEKVTKHTRPLHNVATSNVTARLFNSNPLKVAMVELMPSIRRALSIEPAQASARGKERLKDSRTPQRTDRGQPMRPEHSLDDESSLEEDIVTDSGEQSASDDNQAVPARKGRNKKDETEESDSNESYSLLDARVASDSEHDAANESEGSIHAAAADKGSHPTIGPSLSSSHAMYDSDSLSSTIKQKGSTGTKQPPSTSAFLPSLTMGGYWSGSESGSEPEQDIEQIAPRRNRRGQRARQQIWEKKYGKGAKHLQKGQKPGQGRKNDSRDQGWDMKRGAQLETHGNMGPGNRDRGRQARASTGANSVDLGTTRNTKEPAGQQPRRNKPRSGIADDKSLHPSWEAARKAKEQRQTGSFAGTKVVFD